MFLSLISLFQRKKIVDVTNKGVDRAQKKKIADDTMKRLEKNPEMYLKQVEKSCMYVEDDEMLMEDIERPCFETKFVISTKTTLKALYAIEKNVCCEKVAVLNFASAKNPGGGFLKGSAAQEESLARSSTLYMSLIKFKKPFYEYNKMSPGVYTDRIIYSPEISFFKNDEGKFLQMDCRDCAVITCPAVNAGVSKKSKEEVKDLMRTRMRKILNVAFRNKKTVLILGAFGCGVFKNDPNDVAEIWRELLFGDYKGCFEEVHFALYGPQENAQAFELKFG